MLQALLVDDDSRLADALFDKLDRHAVSPSRISANRCEPASLAPLCQAADVVLVVSSSCDSDAAQAVSTSLDQVITALCGSGKRLLYLSEATVIGDTGDSFGNEDNSPSSSAPHAWQVAAEQHLSRAGSTGIHPVIVRPALVHGKGAGGLLERLLERAERTGESVYVGDGSARTSTVHIDDLAALVGLALQHAPAGATYFASSPEVLSWQEVAAIVAQSTSSETKTRSVTAAEAEGMGLDAGTMSINCVIRDSSPLRRFGWSTHGPTFGPSAPAASVA